MPLAALSCVSLLSAVVATSPPVDSPADSPCGSFVSMRQFPGLYLPARATSAETGCPAAESTAEGGIAGANCEAIATSLDNPGPIWRDGNLLYVGNNADGTAYSISVIDASVSGAEVVVATIDSPVNPVDIAVTLGRLYVIDQTRAKLYSRPLAGGPWTFIALPNAAVTEWDYGHIIEPFGNRMYVIHQWENKISVVNLETETVETTITDLDHLPDRVIFTNDGGIDKMIVLGVGLDAPSCFANGPNFSVFTLPDHTKLYRKNISGACPMEVLADDGKVWVIFDNRIRRYSLATGALEVQLQVNGIGRNAIHRGSEIVAQTNGGEVLTIEPGLGAFTPVCDLVTGSQIWFPPLEQFEAMPGFDGRVFVTNRNNGTVDRISLGVPCVGDLDGDGSIGASDLAVLLGQWQGAGSADVDGSGIVDAADLSVLVGAWGDC